MNPSHNSCPKGDRHAFWDDRKSITLTRVCVWALLALSAAGIVSGPWMISWLVRTHVMRLAPAAAVPLLYVISYCCAALALCTLFLLARFLRRIEQGDIFCAKNVAALRGIGWCCVLAAVLCLTAGFLLYLPFSFIGLAAGFMALIVRVVKNAFEQAICMKSELDLTV